MSTYVIEYYKMDELAVISISFIPLHQYLFISTYD